METINELRTPFRPEGFDFNGLEALPGAHCLDCDERFFPSRNVCLACSGTNIEPIPINTHAKIYSYTVIHRAPPAFKTPYGCGWVITEDGVKLWTMFKGPIEKLRVGMPVKIAFDKLGDQTIYYFEPADSFYEEVNE